MQHSERPRLRCGELRDLPRLRVGFPGGRIAAEGVPYRAGPRDQVWSRLGGGDAYSA
jgi:hypothetical protein